MKLAWICYKRVDEDDDYVEAPEILFEEPNQWNYNKVIPIVYAELK
jgi:hypothetical protein